jgi:molybdopterin adenylyltransferase
MVNSKDDKAKIRVAVLTASDRSFSGERDDLSGKVVTELARSENWEIISYGVLPDEKALLKNELARLADELKADLVFTTGGTGLAPRDFTPEATLEIIDKEVPGMAEAMRAESLQITPHAMLSRAVCGIRGHTLIVNLPGSPQAVRECLHVLLPALPHAMELLAGGVRDCNPG